MTRSQFPFAIIRAGLCVLAAGASCAIPSVVKPTCVISWDRSADWRIHHYKVSVWRDGQVQGNSAYTVSAPASQVSCQDVGAHEGGNWKATIQACLKDEICSEPSKPVSFTVVEK